MRVANKRGDKLLAIVELSEQDLPKLAPLTHALVLARHAGKTLLVFDRYQQHWELPGGMIDAGETPPACAARELEEESGQVCPPRALGFVAAMKLLLQPNRLAASIHVEYGALYRVEIERAAPFVPNRGISKVCWWDGSEELKDLDAIDKKLTELF